MRYIFLFSLLPIAAIGLAARFIYAGLSLGWNMPRLTVEVLERQKK